MTADGWTGVYDALAPTYDQLADADGWSVNDAMAELLAPCALDPSHVLDLGAGTGRTAEVLRRLHPSAHLTLVDPSAAMLTRAAARVPGAEAVCTDASTFLGAAHRSWDLVAAMGVLELVPDIHEVVRRAADRLRPGGHLVASHEPLRPGHPVQGTPVSTVAGGNRVRRVVPAALEETAAGAGLTRIASREVVAYERSDGGGDAWYELVLWRRD